MVSEVLAHTRTSSGNVPGAAGRRSGHTQAHRLTGGVIRGMAHLPADIKDPRRREEILRQLLDNIEAKIKEMEDRRELVANELRMVD